MLLFAVLAACTQELDALYAACDQDVTDLERDAATDLGFSAADVLAWLEAEHTSSLSLDGESTGTDLTITVASAGTARFVDQREADLGDTGEADPAIASVCTDYLELDLQIGFATADGAFAESWEVALPVEQVAGGQVSLSLANDAFAGTYTVPEAMVAACDSSHVQVDLFFSQDGGTSGDVWLACEKTDGDTVSEGIEPLAHWGSGEVE